MSNNLPKITVEQIARPLLAIIMIMCYWACDPQDADASVARDRDGVVRVYDYPADQRAGFNACVKKQREMREIPGDETAYRAWFAKNEGSEWQLDWAAAYEVCRTAHLTVEDFDFSNMVLVRVERFDR